MSAALHDFPPREEGCTCRRVRPDEIEKFAVALQAVNATTETALLVSWRDYGSRKVCRAMVKHHPAEKQPATARAAVRYIMRRYWFALDDHPARAWNREGRAA